MAHLTESTATDYAQNMLLKYSVLLLTPGYLASNYGADTVFCHVFGADTAAAIAAARAEAIDIYKYGSADDFFVLLIIAGHHADLNAGKFEP